MEKRQCQFCGKKFEGYTIHQVEYQVKQHILSVHADKITIQSIPVK